MIAEYHKIVFNEYLPTILGQNLMDRYDLRVRRNGYTSYDPNVDPTGIQSVGGAALRFGHLTTVGSFQVLNEPKHKSSYNFRLRDKFEEMSDIWDGRV